MWLFIYNPALLVDYEFHDEEQFKNNIRTEMIEGEGESERKKRRQMLKQKTLA